MFVIALGRLAEIDINQYKNTKFSDVAEASTYAPYIAWVDEKNIAKGINATSFAPDKSISRQEIMLIMQNYAKAMGYTI